MQSCQGYHKHKGVATGWHGATAECQLGKAKGTRGQNLALCQYIESKFLRCNLQLTEQFGEYIRETKSLPVGVGTGSQRCSRLQLRAWVLGEIRHH